tara:strand:- start:2497 stop:2994 length:498 start_codon:yes stop_codon:yes gene_type:complete
MSNPLTFTKKLPILNIDVKMTHCNQTIIFYLPKSYIGKRYNIDYSKSMVTLTPCEDGVKCAEQKESDRCSLTFSKNRLGFVPSPKVSVTLKALCTNGTFVASLPELATRIPKSHQPAAPTLDLEDSKQDSFEKLSQALVTVNELSEKVNAVLSITDNKIGANIAL